MRLSEITRCDRCSKQCLSMMLRAMPRARDERNERTYVRTTHLASFRSPWSSRAGGLTEFTGPGTKTVEQPSTRTTKTIEETNV